MAFGKYWWGEERVELVERVHEDVSSLFMSDVG